MDKCKDRQKMVIFYTTMAENRVLITRIWKPGTDTWFRLKISTCQIKYNVPVL